MKLLRAIAITCFASFFAIIAYGQGEVVDLDKMELLAENCESDGEGACKDVLIDLMDQIAALAAQDSDVMEPMECPEVEQEEQSDGGADCNVHITAKEEFYKALRWICGAARYMNYTYMVNGAFDYETNEYYVPSDLTEASALLRDAEDEYCP